jgi:hypothetical protein
MNLGFSLVPEYTKIARLIKGFQQEEQVSTDKDGSATELFNLMSV